MCILAPYVAWICIVAMTCKTFLELVTDRTSKQYQGSVYWQVKQSVSCKCCTGGKLQVAWQVEVLAKTVLDAPVEIQVGGRSVVNADITQARRGSRVVQQGSRGVRE